jgi:hypothetical protein
MEDSEQGHLDQFNIRPKSTYADRKVFAKEEALI